MRVRITPFFRDVFVNCRAAITAVTNPEFRTDFGRTPGCEVCDRPIRGLGFRAVRASASGRQVGKEEGGCLGRQPSSPGTEIGSSPDGGSREE
jgi:hypothetical protein